ncbi:hypothetical protein [Pseudomonas sp. 10S4]|uniref:hypothetical protein n=1 Tax=Pseudomonas sp. 10S4 TaxID=3048583 RepID=UPI002AC9A032|nr:MULTISPECIES: hypothetical protein [unclassified Pseudomonas]MEB0224063.1 hypothetical protein [Pseudomonas sp. 5S1]MEB0296278.1 hypothetical protein [Pseudomonas sp. 10S4]WPX20097.1 hypothetical protein RHM58_09215 [Pseudomonas sp. 10S4]
MLLDPYLNQPHLPKLSYWVGSFGVYDREETLGEELNKYDPNDPVDRDLLIRRYCLRLLPRETFHHRSAEFDLLEQTLGAPDFDFASVWEDDEDDFHDYWSWPSDWPEITDPRGFFQAIRDTAEEVWHEDLLRSKLPSLQSCREIPERDLGTCDWLFSVGNSQEWKSVFNLAVTPSDLKTPGPVFHKDGFTLSIEGPINHLIFRPSHWPPSTAFTYCELDASVSGISELEFRGSQFAGQLRGVLTRLKVGYYLRMEIGFDCVIECVALHVNIANVVGSYQSKSC